MIILIQQQEEAEIRSNLGGELEIGMNGARNVPALASPDVKHKSLCILLFWNVCRWKYEPLNGLVNNPACVCSQTYCSLQQRAEHNVRLLPVTGVSCGRQTLQLLGADDGGLGCTVPSLTDSH